MSLLYHAYVYLEFLILACTIYILAPEILICILGVAEEVIVIYLYLAILVAKLESQLHILTEGL